MTVSVADEQRHPVPSDRLVALAEHVLAAEAVPAAMQLDLLLVDEDVIAQLNEAHLGAEGPTDVLAFPIDAPGEADDDVPAVLGDVVLCPAVAQRQRAHDPAGELEMLTVHGILHLLGHDHAEARERRVMFERTDELLAGFRSGAEGGAPGPADVGEGRP